MSNNVLNLLVKLKALDTLSQPLQKAGTAANTTAKRLKALEAAQRQINGYRKLQGELNDTGAKLDQARQKTRALQNQLMATAAPSEKLRKEYSASRTALGALERAQAKQTDRLSTMRQRMQSAGIATDRLADYERKLQRATSHANTHLEKQQATLKQLAEREARLQNIRERHGKSMTHMAAIGAAGYAGLHTGQRVGRSLFGALQPGIEFDAAMSEVQALSRLSKNDPALKALRDQAQHLGATTQFTGADAARGQAFLAMAGFTPEAIRDAMPGLLDLAAAGGLDLARTADIASNIGGAFKIPASEMNRVADILAFGASTANTNLEMLGETMKYVGPVARTAGLDLETTTAMAGLLGNVGIQASSAGTQLSEMLNRLAKEGGPAAKALDSLGIKAIDDNGDLRIVEVIGEIGKAIDGMGTGERLSILQEIFGKRAGVGMAELVDREGVGALTKYAESFRDIEGTAKRMADTRLDNLQGDLTRLSSAWQNIGLVLATQVGPALRAATGWLTGLLGGIADLITRFPNTTKAILLTVAAFAALATVGGGILITFVAIASPIKMILFGLSLLTGQTVTFMMIMGKLGLVIGKLGIALKFLLIAGGPVVWLIRLLAVLAFLVYRNWDSIGAFFTDRWNDIKQAFGGGLLGIGKLLLDWNPVGLLYRGIAALLNWLGLDVPEKLSDIGSAIVDGLLTGLANAFPRLAGFIQNLGEIMPGWLKKTLGIQSPSRVFATIGADSMAGLAMGLEKNTGVPVASLSKARSRLQKTGQGIALAAAIGTAGAPALAAPGGEQVVINVYAAPGQSEEEIGRIVAEKLADHQRRNRSNLRSSLFDRE